MRLDTAADPRGSQTVVLVDLAHLGAIEVSGADAEQFISGQFTNDFAAVDDRHAAIGAWCSANGRVQLVFRVLRWRRGFLLLVPRALLASTLKRLALYVLRARVQVSDASADYDLLGLIGTGSTARLRSLFSDLPQRADEVTHEAGRALMMLPGPVPRFMVLGGREAITAFKDQLGPDLAEETPSYWLRQDILAGLPLILAETAGSFLPQTLNLEALGGLSYKKGCYPGQEVIARLRYRGELKKRMYRAHSEPGRSPAPGDPIVAGDGSLRGTVLIAVREGGGGSALLAVMDIGAAERQTLYLGSTDGPQIRIESLP
ncbi:MAG: YgfZ/GcvT domain-containing protein [Gammaproteobacteria bacterium]